MPVHRVAHDWVVAPGKVHADLVRPPGLELAAHMRISPVARDDLPVRDGIAAVFFRDGHLLAVRRVAADGRVDRSGILFEIAADDALLGPCERVVFELRG